MTVSSRQEWLAARVALLEREKQLTRLSDELAEARRRLPRVRIDKPYGFETDGGPKTPAELFDGRTQLLVYHFMRGPHSPNGAPAAPTRPTATTARSRTSMPTTSPSSWRPGHRSRR